MATANQQEHALLYQDVWPGTEDDHPLWKGRAIWRIAERVVKIESVVRDASTATMTASLFDGRMFHAILTFGADELALATIPADTEDETIETVAADAFTNDMAEMLVVVYAIITGKHSGESL